MGLKVFEKLMATYSANVKKNINLHLREAQSTPRRVNKYFLKCLGQIAENQRQVPGQCYSIFWILISQSCETPLTIFSRLYLCPTAQDMELFSMESMKIFSLLLVLGNFIMMCLGRDFSYFLNLGFVELLGSVGLYFSINLENLWPLLFQIFFCPLLQKSNYTYIGLPGVVPQQLVLTQHLFKFLLCALHVWFCCSVFTFTDLLLCSVKFALNPIQCSFHFTAVF